MDGVPVWPPLLMSGTPRSLLQTTTTLLQPVIRASPKIYRKMMAAAGGRDVPCSVGVTPSQKFLSACMFCWLLSPISNALIEAGSDGKDIE